jgi:hypothetical protein
MKNQERQRKLLDHTFKKLCSGLSNLVGRFGGDLLSEELANKFNLTAHERGSSLVIKAGEVSRTGSQIDWRDYHFLLTSIIEVAIRIGGKKTVSNEIQQIVKQIEQDTATNLFEVCYRLGVQDYIK